MGRARDVARPDGPCLRRHVEGRPAQRGARHDGITPSSIAPLPVAFAAAAVAAAAAAAGSSRSSKQQAPAAAAAGRAAPAPHSSSRSGRLTSPSCGRRAKARGCRRRAGSSTASCGTAVWWSGPASGGTPSSSRCVGEGEMTCGTKEMMTQCHCPTLCPARSSLWSDRGLRD